MILSGTLTFTDPDAEAPYRDIHLYVEDTRRVGADAVRRAEARIPVPQGDLAQTALPFEIEVEGDASGLTLRAHMPTHPGADIQEGDMITMGSHPISGDAAPRVELKRVR
ncbi:hypothetical protein [Poseidonocella sedimentorum]|uniref:Uncharacterized protein n=1 Tax=Poseidonocella sedimentorum TaxID=871652 RepID=A0A1I6DZW6_9RHOB|nr:hypothetical protein [Poseidonocella sedimentorum]SFR10966.1 hypothetical protein SAMN04515673_106142 [Poseidonocella sedimentorum]